VTSTAQARRSSISSNPGSAASVGSAGSNERGFEVTARV